MAETNLTLKIKNIGEAPGTVGWLQKNAKAVTLGVTKSGKRCAYLEFYDETKTQWIVKHDPYNISDRAPEFDSLQIVLRHGDCGCDGLSFPVTDACWESISALAEKVRAIMDEVAENETRATFILTPEVACDQQL